MLNLKS